jgi:hypothetical protein
LGHSVVPIKSPQVYLLWKEVKIALSILEIGVMTLSATIFCFSYLITREGLVSLLSHQQFDGAAECHMFGISSPRTKRREHLSADITSDYANASISRKFLLKTSPAKHECQNVDWEEHSEETNAVQTTETQIAQRWKGILATPLSQTTQFITGRRIHNPVGVVSASVHGPSSAQGEFILVFGYFRVRLTHSAG